ncbi:MAG: 2-dehydropantoate 2-reductase [Chlamydiales bacterium]|jgi:2-dehydropantoate 2-reductase
MTFADLDALAAGDQVPDIGQLLPGRQGRAVRFRALVERFAPSPDAVFVHVLSSDASFSANLDLQRLTEHGLLVYALDGGPLPDGAGGPFRLFVTESEDCSINVKSVARITFAAEPGAHTAACAEEPSVG